MKISRRGFLDLSCAILAAGFVLDESNAEAGLHFHGFGPTVYVAEGDSITEAGTTYPVLYAQTRPQIILHDIAVSGNTLGNLQSRNPPAESYGAGGKNILSVLIGHNDIVQNYPVGGTRAAWLSALATYLDSKRAAGMKVVLCTILPSTVAGFNAERNAVNAVLSGWVGSHCDALCDFASDPTMGPDAAAADLSLYQDGIHPTLAGQIALQAVITPVLDLLI